MIIFDSQLLRNRKNQQLANILASDFYQFIQQDLVDRLQILQGDFRKILLIDILDGKWLLPKLTKLLPKAAIEVIAPDHISTLESQQYELIIYPFNLHWQNDVQQFLVQIRKLLTPKAVFMGNFAGAGSLQNLRRALIMLAEANQQAHVPRIAPLINLEQMNNLLKWAEFREIIVDNMSLQISSTNILQLMRLLKSIGENNHLHATKHLALAKTLHKALLTLDQEFDDTIELISFATSLEKSNIQLKA